MATGEAQEPARRPGRLSVHVERSEQTVDTSRLTGFFDTLHAIAARVVAAEQDGQAAPKESNTLLSGAPLGQDTGAGDPSPVAHRTRTVADTVS